MFLVALKPHAFQLLKMSGCSHDCTLSNSNVYQTLDELDFERGLWYAAQNNDESRVLHLLNTKSNVNERDKSGYTALHYASRNNHGNICKILLDRGADINATTRAGQATSLHRASLAGHYHIVKMLLNANANILAQDADGRTALHRAVENGSYEIVKLLLNHQPKLSFIKDSKNQLPVHLTNDEDILKLFKI